MITCPKCQYVRQPSDTAPDYECPRCGIIYAKYDPGAEARRQALLEQQRQGRLREELERQEMVKKQATKQAERDRFENMCLTTSHEVPGREVAAVVEVISSECAFGMNLFKDFFTGLTDFFGGRSGSTQNTLRDARRTVMRELRREAFELGADAVIAIDLNYSEFSGGGKSMLFVVATGTAVKLKPKND